MRRKDFGRLGERATVTKSCETLQGLVTDTSGAAQSNYTLGATPVMTTTARDMQQSDLEFALAEFVQLHEHIRQQDNSMVQLLTVLLVSSTALMSAVGAYVFQQLADAKSIAVPTGYMFLSPIIILIPGLAMLRAHRASIYRMGTFIKVFLETPPRGAQWHHGLAEFSSGESGESFDHVPMTVWMLSALSIALFCMALVLSHADWVHWLAPVPLITMVGIGHKKFFDAKNAAIPEASWLVVRSKLTLVPVPPVAGEAPNEPLQPTAPLDDGRRG